MGDGRSLGYQREQEVSAPEITEEDLKVVIEKGNGEKLNDVTSRLGKYYASGRRQEKLSSSQIRNVLDRIQRMGKYDNEKLQILRPLLAYAAGRHGGKVKELQKIVDQAIRKVNNEKSFENFKNFFEAIVAYHRYYGGE